MTSYFPLPMERHVVPLWCPTESSCRSPPPPPQEESAKRLKAYVQRFGTLRIIDGGESTPDALFGKLNAVIVEMIHSVSVHPVQSVCMLSLDST